MHEMVMAAIIPPPPNPSSGTAEVGPTGSTVLTWNHKKFYSISIIYYIVSHRLIHKQKISSEFTKTNYNYNYNPHTKSLDKSQLFGEVSEHDCSDQVSEHDCSDQVSEHDCSDQVSEHDCSDQVSEHDCSDQVKVKVNLKESHNRSGVAQRVSGGLGSQIPWQVGGEDVSLTHRPPLSPGNVPGIHFY
jgi:hypothetical protein